MSTGAIRPIGCPFGVDPRDWRNALAQRIERQAAILSALIDALDVMDGDCDLEANGDAEPWLGWCASMGLANGLDLEVDESPLDSVPISETNLGRVLGRNKTSSVLDPAPLPRFWSS